MRPLLALLLLAPLGHAAPTLVGSKTPIEPIVTGLKNPESVCVGPDGRMYVTIIGEFNKTGDGSVVVIKDGKAEPFCEGLDDPKGIVAARGAFFVTDRDKVLQIDSKGKSRVLADTKAFPVAPMFLNDIEADSRGNLYVSDSGDHKGKGGKIFKIAIEPRGKGGDPRGKGGEPGVKVTVLADAKTNPAFKGTNGLRWMSEYHLLALDAFSGDLLRTRVTDGQTEVVLEGAFPSGDGITFDHWGRIYLTSWAQGKMWVMDRPNAKPRLYAEGFVNAADCCLSRDGKSILVPDMKGGKLYSVPCVPTGDKPLAAKVMPAFPDGVEWEGWEAAPEKGPSREHRPLLVTHFGDGTGRVVVGEQHGMVHTLPKDAKGGKAKLFLDIRDRVRYVHTENEEGFLGLAFAPDYKTKGEFYAYYTPRYKGKDDRRNRLSRFKVSKDDPDRADPASEEILLEYKKPFWNHDGGTIVFGPDGMLYVTIGDGGFANDPEENGQNKGTVKGKVLRLDVGKRGDKTPYAIPKDNPFVGDEKARPEVWAYGFRNVWRMSFDRETGALWAADVGQNLWEEINLVEKGGNYGWNPRESYHPFGKAGVGTEAEKTIDPVWEYHHDLGKSITGGHVYRGKAVPDLAGKYVYADYVSGHVWALNYDVKAKKVLGNHLVREGGFPVMSFGEDEAGEVYLLTMSPRGTGVHKLVAK